MRGTTMRSKPRTASRLGTVLVAGAVVAALLAATPVTASEEDGAAEAAVQRLVGEDAADDAQPLVIQGAEESAPVTPTLSNKSLADAVADAGWQPGDAVIELPRHNYRGDFAPPGEPANPTDWTVDSLLELQERAGSSRALSAPLLNFAGQGFTGVSPPDPVGDVGTTYYAQGINTGGGASVAVYDKTTGALVGGPVAFSILWGAGGACATGSGDPIILYDQLADRWLLSEFASTGNHLCVYVSLTGNVLTSPWYNYDFATPNFPDYPKYAVWPDAYYVSTNEASPTVYALDRTQMLAGNPATYQRFTAPALAGFGFQALTPADVDGPAPPAGAPGIFARHRDDEAHNVGSNNPAADFLDLFEFTVDWVTPANSTFTGPVSIPTAEFDSDLCGFFSFFCFPQPTTANTLDPLREVIMWRLVYRNFGSHQTLVGNFVTDVNGADLGGVRWFELRKSGVTPWSLHQEGTLAPDTHNRWMGAIAMDQNANMALGYSVSSATVFPSLNYVGRQAGALLGTMPEAEQTLVLGGSSWNASTRWGDYSAMSVDPVDGCTFWFTGETVNGVNQWATQIGTFKFASCAPDAVAPTVTITAPGNGGSVAQGASALASYSCTDTGSGVESCVGDVPSGAPIDTCVVGPKTFTVTGKDHAGNVATLTHNYTVIGGTPVVADGCFEAGTPNPSWNEASTNFGTPLCSLGSCGGGGTTDPAHGGLWWAWFGGTPVAEIGAVDQNVTIPASGSATLTFYVRIPAANAPGFMDAKIDGTKLFGVTDADAAAYATYQLVTLDVTAYADGGTHNLEFVSSKDPGGVTNIFLDDVLLSYVPDVTAPAVTLTSPANGASFTRGTAALAAYSCADEAGGSGLASCVGTVANGAAIDTATSGAKTFTVTGTDNAGNPKVVTHNYTVIDPDTVGLVDITTGKWYLRNSAGAITSFFYGNPVDLPISGDWNGDGVSTPGLYRQSDGFFYARDTNTQGPANNECFAGDPSDIPVVGDWDGDGDDNLGIYRPSEQKFYLFTITCTGSPMGAAQIVLGFGNPGDKPVAGDWDGDGMDEVGLHRESTGFFYWRNTLDTGIASGQIFFGDPNDRFVAGDWGIVDGVDTPAIFRPSDLKFYFRHTLTQGNADSSFAFAGAGSGWLPVSGAFGLG